MDIKLTLIDFAETCRAAFDTMSTEERGDRFASFPSGTCGDVANLVARLLHEEFHLESEYICGWFNPGESSATHAWVEVDGYIIDLTHDQFAAGPYGTGLSDWVFERSEWHQQLYRNPSAPLLDPGDWPGFPYEAYEALRRSLKRARR